MIKFARGCGKPRARMNLVMLLLEREEISFKTRFHRAAIFTIKGKE